MADFNAYENNAANVILGSLQDVITTGVSNLTPAVFLSGWITNIAGDLLSSIDLENLDATQDSSRYYKAIMNSSKALLGKGYSSLSMSILKKKPNKPVKPSMPTANYSEMYYQ